MRSCPSCGYSVSANAENNERAVLQRRRRKKYSIMNQAYMAIFTFTLGCFGLYYFQSKFAEEASNWLEVLYQISMLLLPVGFLWYVVCRIRLYLLKKGA